MTEKNESVYNRTLLANYDLDCLKREWLDDAFQDEDISRCSIANVTEEEFDHFYFYQVKFLSFFLWFSIQFILRCNPFVNIVSEIRCFSIFVKILDF